MKKSDANTRIVFSIRTYALFIFSVLVLVYGLLWARYAMAERVLRFDPVVAMNSEFAEVPEAERGWSKMREALLAMRDDEPEVADMLREASRSKVLGFYAGYVEDLSSEDALLWPELQSGLADDLNPDPWDWERSALTISLPHLASLRQAAMFLKDDALEHGEGGGVENLRAIRRIAGFASEQPTLINQLVGLAIFSLEAETAARMIVQYGSGWSDDTFDQVHDELELARQSVKDLNLDGESILFQDVVQRVYSDDGSGGGIFMAEPSAWLTGAGGGTLGSSSGLGMFFTILTKPILSQWMPDRKATTALYAKLSDEQLQYGSKPMWQRPSDIEFQPTGNLVIDLLLPSVSKAFDQVHMTRMRLSSVQLVGEAYRVKNRTGKFPEVAPFEVQDCWARGGVNYEVTDGVLEIRSLGPDQNELVMFPPPSED